ncbi:MAG: TolC family protein [Nitrospirae bacterium]|nr:TolC family protein [Nitrospirota bacterium]
MQNRIIGFFIVIVFVLLGVGALSAEDGINLEQSLSAFYSNNYDILISKYEIDKAQADYIAARLIPNPNLSFNYSFIGLKGFPSTTDNTQTTLRVDQLIELGGKRGLRSDFASVTIEAVKLTQKDTVRLLLIGFYTLFFNINADILNAELAKEELKRFDRTLEIADRRFRAGFLSYVDYAKLKIARIDLENNLSTLQAQMNNDIEQFSFLLGSSTPLKPSLSVREDFSGNTEDDLLQRAYQYRFDLLSIEKQINASEFNKQLAQSQAVPDITVGLEFETVEGWNNPSIGFGISIPLPIFNRNQGEIARRQAELYQLQAERDKVKRQIVSDIRQALNNYSSSIHIFESYKSRKSDLDDLKARSEKAFSLGGITILDLLDTEKTYRDFMTKYNQALVQGNLNRELLKVYTGEIL